MENSALEAPAHRLLVVRHEHQLHPSGRRRGPGLQGHAAVGIDVPLSMTTRSSRRTTTDSVWSSKLWATEVGEPLSLLCAVDMFLASVTA